MKLQALLSLKNKSKKIKMSSAAIFFFELLGVKSCCCHFDVGSVFGHGCLCYSQV